MGVGVLGVHHVALVVDDLDAALAFWRDQLDGRELARPDVGVPGAWLQLGSLQVHLVVGDVPARSGQHVALAVGDLDAAVAALEASGQQVRRLGDAQAFLRDPAGNLVELQTR